MGAVKLENTSSIISKSILIVIFIPLILNIYFIDKIGINFAYLVFAIQIAAIFFSLNKIKVRYKNRQVLTLFLIFILFTISAISSLFSEFQLQSLKISFLVFVTSIFILLLSYSDSHPINTLMKCMKFFVYIGVVFSTIAVTLFLFGNVTYVNGDTVQSLNLGPFRLYQVIMGMPPFYRVASLTSNPNTLGIILMMSQIATLYLMRLKLLTRWKFTIFYVIQIAGLLLAQSRSAIITSLIMIIIFSILVSDNFIKRLRTLGVFFILLISMYFIMIIQPVGIFSRFQNGLSDRDEAWGIIINKILENPFIGAGFGVSGEAYLNELGIKAHNVFLNSLSEIGLIGVIFFVLIWALGIVYSFLGAINKSKNKIERSTFALLFSILFSFVAHQMVENKLLVYDFVMFFWIYLISISTHGVNLTKQKGLSKTQFIK